MCKFCSKTEWQTRKLEGKEMIDEYGAQILCYGQGVDKDAMPKCANQATHLVSESWLQDHYCRGCAESEGIYDPDELQPIEQGEKCYECQQPATYAILALELTYCCGPCLKDVVQDSGKVVSITRKAGATEV